MSGSTSADLPSDTRAAAVARSFVLAQSAGLEEELRYTLTLIASELVTNAVRHGRGPLRLELRVDAGSVWGAVHDCGAAFIPGAGLPAADAPGGRGLFIVASLAARWGVTAAPRGEGKAVWFEVPVPR